MPISAVVTDVTPYRLQYLLVVTAGDVGSIVTQTLINPVPPGAGLANDAQRYRIDPLFNLLSTPVSNQAAARRALFGDGDTSNLTGVEHPRCEVSCTPRNSQPVQSVWSVDADVGVGTSAGRIVLVVQTTNVVDIAGYLDIHYKHTRHR